MRELVCVERVIESSEFYKFLSITYQLRIISFNNDLMKILNVKYQSNNYYEIISQTCDNRISPKVL
jgi:hypothetical protein